MDAPRGCLFVLLLSTLPLAAQAPNAFCAKLAALTTEPSVSAAHWGIAVETLSGTLLCGFHQAQLFRPASTNKLFTATAALALLGEDHRFTTQVIAEGTVSDGTLTGNLVLAGGGDPSFGTTDLPYRKNSPRAYPPTIADLDAFADTVYAAGIRTITGDILGDDRRFAYEPYPSNWSVDDLTYGYAAPVSALAVHDNAVELQVSAGRPTGDPPTVTLSPDRSLLFAFTNSIVRTPSGPGCSATLGYARSPDQGVLEVHGSIADSSPPCQQSLAIPEDPALFAAHAFKLALEQRHIRVGGLARPRHEDLPRDSNVSNAGSALGKYVQLLLARPYLANRPDGSCLSQAIAPAADEPAPPQSQLATHTSATLAEDLTYTLKESDNLHAEITLRNLGAALSCEHTLRAGLDAVRAFLLQTGVQPQDIALSDGSGLSDHDLTTPRALAQVLVFAARQPWFRIFKAMLPTGGVDGTLASRFTGPLEGRVFGKTGTLGESRALAGYLTADSGQTLIFAILDDNHLPQTTADRVQMDKIVELIAAQN